MPGTPRWLDVFVIPGLIAPEHRDQVVWLYPSSLLNRRPPSQAPPSGARTTSDPPRQPESGSARCFVTVAPLLACFFRSCQLPAHFKKRVHRSPVPSRGNDGKLFLNRVVGEFGFAVAVGTVEINFAVQNANHFT